MFPDIKKIVGLTNSTSTTKCYKYRFATLRHVLCKLSLVLLWVGTPCWSMQTVHSGSLMNVGHFSVIASHTTSHIVFTPFSYDNISIAFWRKAIKFWKLLNWSRMVISELFRLHPTADRNLVFILHTITDLRFRLLAGIAYRKLHHHSKTRFSLLPFPSVVMEYSSNEAQLTSATRRKCSLTDCCCLCWLNWRRVHHWWR